MYVFSMAMPLENGVILEKCQFPGGGEMLHQRQWFPDGRDELIYWLRGEFAAANAMIDSLCEHLAVVGEPGEYDSVVASIRQRRCNWSHVLHMQQFFPTIEVTNALQEVGWRRQQRKGQGRELKRTGGGFRQRESVVQNGRSVAAVEEKIDMVEKIQEGSCTKVPGSPQVKKSHSSEVYVKPRVDCEGHCDVPLENGLHAIQNLPVKQNGTITAKTFVTNEIVDGKTVNLVDGIKLYDEMLNISEVAKIVTLVNDMRAAGKRGELQGHTFVLSKRPMKGHGREMIHLGLPIANALLEGENAIRVCKDQNMLPFPQLLQDFIDRLVCTQVLTVKPDSCIIDVFHEGDYSHPQMWPPWYGRPVSVLFLTECEMTFGKSIVAEYPGDYTGSLSLSLQPGSMLVMKGNSTDLAKYAIPSFKKQRILVTLTKFQPRKPAPIDVHRQPLQSPHWGPPPSRSPTHLMPNHYGTILTNGMLPAQPVHPQLVIAPVALPPHQPPRLPLSGTGVFLPPGSSHIPKECNGKFGTDEQQQQDVEPETGKQANIDF